MQRYFMKEKDFESADALIRVPDEHYHHMVNVMRMKIGDECYFVYSEGQTWRVKVREVTPECVLVSKEEFIKKNSEMPVDVTLFCGFPKGDKLEWITQKATELGAFEIIGFPAKTSVVKWNDKKRLAKEQRLAKIATEAAEQSHRQRVPSITLLSDTKELIQRAAEYDVVLIAYEESAKQGEMTQLSRTLNQLKVGMRVACVFGPEGGLTPQEVQQLMETGALACGLGPRILRAETAPLYLLSAISYQLEMQG